MLTGGGGYAGKKGYLEPIDYKTVTEKLDKAVELEHVVGAEVYDSEYLITQGYEKRISIR